MLRHHVLSLRELEGLEGLEGPEGPEGPTFCSLLCRLGWTSTELGTHWDKLKIGPVLQLGMCVYFTVSKLCLSCA